MTAERYAGRSVKLPQSANADSSLGEGAEQLVSAVGDSLLDEGAEQLVSANAGRSHLRFGCRKE